MKTQLLFSILFVSASAIRLAPDALPPRQAHPLSQPSKIVHGEIPDGFDAIKASKGDGTKGPTFDHRFSDDETGPHKVEVYRSVTMPSENPH